MTELTFEQQAEVEQQKAEREAAEQQEAQLRKLARIQAEANEQRSLEEKMKNIGSLSDAELRELTQKNWGFSV